MITGREDGGESRMKREGERGERRGRERGKVME